jgi:uncharacterized protein YegP (UPF0339 family)
MRIRYEIYIGQDRFYHWRLVAANNQIVCWSEGYSSRQAAIDSINWVKTNGPTAPLL